MGCDICEPILSGDGRVDFEPGHVEYEKNIMWKHGKNASISIYPKPYKAHKFYKLVGINYCPYCGTDLKTGNGWYPKLIKAVEK